MKLHVHLSILLVTLPSYAWVDCAKVSSCASMRSWFLGTPPSNFSENLPYQLSVHGHTKYGYFPGSSHTIYLNGSRNFVGFIVYAENSVKNNTYGHFVQEDLPTGVEEVSCGDFYIIQNSTSSGNWTSVKMLWKAPQSYEAGNITFRASVLENTNPVVYYEGLTAHLKYQCPLRKCVPCPTGVYKYDGYGCRTCQCDCDVACAAIYAPVCGTDGKTYSNKCEMKLYSCKSRSPITVQQDGICGRCSGACKAVYLPVCGTDGKTYSNECRMKISACEKNDTITVSYNGECNVRCSKLCTAEYRPVCGTDGKTYSNRCGMEISACGKNDTITVSYNGECNGRCSKVCTEEYSPVCGTDGKTYHNKCKMELSACVKNDTIIVSYSGECDGRCSKMCTEKYRPVCGTDGKTYSNECKMEISACGKNDTITVSYNGECNGAEETMKFSIFSLMLAFLALLMFSDR